MAKLTNTVAGSGAKGRKADGTYIAHSEADIKAEQQVAQNTEVLTLEQQLAAYNEDRKTGTRSLRTVRNLEDGLYPDTEVTKVTMFTSKTGNPTLRLEMRILTASGEFNYSNIISPKRRDFFETLEFINGGTFDNFFEITGTFDMRLETDSNSGFQGVYAEYLSVESVNVHNPYDDGYDC